MLLFLRLLVFLRRWCILKVLIFLRILCSLILILLRVLCILIRLMVLIFLMQFFFSGFFDDYSTIESIILFIFFVIIFSMMSWYYTKIRWLCEPIKDVELSSTASKITWGWSSLLWWILHVGVECSSCLLLFIVDCTRWWLIFYIFAETSGKTFKEFSFWYLLGFFLQTTITIQNAYNK